MMPEVPVRFAIFGHAEALRQENNNTFRFGKGETLVTSSSWKKERDLTPLSDLWHPTTVIGRFNHIVVTLSWC